MSNILQLFWQSSTYNEYIVKKNLVVIAALWAFNYLTDQFLPGFTRLIELGIACVCVHNIWLHSKHHFTFLSSVANWLKPYLLQSSPILRLHVQFLKRACSTLVGLISSPQAPTQQPNEPQKAPPSQPAQPETLGAQFALPSIHPPQDLGAVSRAGRAPAIQRTSEYMVLPPIRYAPSYVSRRRITKRTNKFLWRLAPTRNVVERFRMEQFQDFEDNWHRFRDNSAKHYYQRLSEWLHNKIILPIVRTVGLLEEQLSSIDTNFVDCPTNVMTMLLMEPKSMDENTFPIPLVQAMLNVRGYENNEARRFVLGRIREIARYRRLCPYAEPGYPSDDEIIHHVFKRFMDHSMPNIIPPLVPRQGDILHYLLVYFYVTEELKQDIFY